MLNTRFITYGEDFNTDSTQYLLAKNKMLIPMPVHTVNEKIVDSSSFVSEMCIRDRAVIYLGKRRNELYLCTRKHEYR